MDIDAIKVTPIGISAGMISLKLPDRLSPGDIPWLAGSNDERKFHGSIADKINECDKVAPGSAVVRAMEIRLMPAMGVDWQVTAAAVKEILKEILKKQ